MPSDKEYLSFVLEQLSLLENISSHAMMGEYIIYYKNKTFCRNVAGNCPSYSECMKNFRTEKN